MKVYVSRLNTNKIINHTGVISGSCLNLKEMEKKKQFIEFLYEIFVNNPSRKGDTEATVQVILSFVERILEILDMEEEDFYALSNEDHLVSYELLKEQMLNINSNNNHKRSIKYAYRNYLEFLGINPEPIRRKRAYVNVQYSVHKISNSIGKLFNKLVKAEGDKEFTSFIMAKQDKTHQQKCRYLRTFRYGISLICKYTKVGEGEFFSFSETDLKEFKNRFMDEVITPNNFKKIIHGKVMVDALRAYYKFKGVDTSDVKYKYVNEIEKSGDLDEFSDNHLVSEDGPISSDVQELNGSLNPTMTIRKLVDGSVLIQIY